MKKIVALSLSLVTTAALVAAENSTYIGGITGSSHFKDEFDRSKISVSGVELGHHYTGNEGGLFAGKLTLHGGLSYISGKKDGVNYSDIEGKILLGDQFDLTNNLSAGPILGIGADKYTIKQPPLYGSDRRTISTTYGALGASVRAVPMDNLKVSLNAYYKKSLIKPQISANYGSGYEDFPKATGYTFEIPIEYKIIHTFSAYAKYTRDTMKFSDSSDFVSFSKNNNLLSAGLSYSW